MHCVVRKRKWKARVAVAVVVATASWAQTPLFTLFDLSTSFAVNYSYDTSLININVFINHGKIILKPLLKYVYRKVFLVEYGVRL